uniref:Uncharacterized protein n=1 Tax=Arundo donax TaxID=35708 RepID=A0A0A9DMB9_ARUDO
MFTPATAKGYSHSALLPSALCSSWVIFGKVYQILQGHEPTSPKICCQIGVLPTHLLPQIRF